MNIYRDVFIRDRHGNFKTIEVVVGCFNATTNRFERNVAIPRATGWAKYRFTSPARDRRRLGA